LKRNEPQIRSGSLAAKRPPNKRLKLTGHRVRIPAIVNTQIG
jgi:hypothetical protein